jgi:hypothetical protein
MTDQQRPLSADDGPFVPTGEPNPLPAGEAFEADANTRYNLMVNYKTWQDGSPTSGLMYPMAPNAWHPYWDYMTLGSSQGGSPAAKFKVEPWGDGTPWQRWTLENGNFLSLKATGWVYESSAYPIAWKIVGGYLYNSYWGGQVGYSFRSGLEPNAYYVGMGLTPFTCELVPA